MKPTLSKSEYLAVLAYADAQEAVTAALAVLRCTENEWTECLGALLDELRRNPDLEEQCERELDARLAHRARGDHARALAPLTGAALMSAARWAAAKARKG